MPSYHRFEPSESDSTASGTSSNDDNSELEGLQFVMVSTAKKIEVAHVDKVLIATYLQCMTNCVAFVVMATFEI